MVEPMSSPNNSTVHVGTRGSELALIQTGLVIDELKKANSSVSFEIVIIKTTGDKDRRLKLEELGVGVFVRELETALLDGRIDIAVHSLKDMPSSLPAERRCVGLELERSQRREEADLPRT